MNASEAISRLRRLELPVVSTADAAAALAQTAFAASKTLGRLAASGVIQQIRHGLFWLTRRELEVLYSVAEGATAQQISQQLHVALKTIERHCESIFRKLGLPNRASVVRFAVERGILGFPRDQWIALAARVRDIDPDAESVLQSSYSLRSLSDSTSAKRIRT